MLKPFPLQFFRLKYVISFLDAWNKKNILDLEVFARPDSNILLESVTLIAAIE